jgi:exopolyphosphatase/guanosine-5'-triphosphate,3'-diphosphate pyrophosphatase
MNANRRAVIDVGTNSVKLLVADVRDGVVEPVMEQGEQTRLGAGFYETHRLQPRAIAHSARVVALFAAKARELQAVSTRVIATSAARDAVNPGDLTSAIEQASGLTVEIISGGQEAEWVFRGVTTVPELASQPLLLLDVGGGSTEFILGRGQDKHFAKSYPLGTVRLLEHLPHGDPPSVTELAACRKWVKDFLANTVRPDLEPALERETRANSEQPPVQLIGTGGTAAVLARMEARLETYDRGRIEVTRLGIAQIKAQVERLWELPLAERKKTIGLPGDRADVILPGVVIYEAVMEEFGFQELRVSTRGLRFAAVMDAA